MYTEQEVSDGTIEAICHCCFVTCFVRCWIDTVALLFTLILPLLLYKQVESELLHTRTYITPSVSQEFCWCMLFLLTVSQPFFKLLWSYDVFWTVSSKINMRWVSFLPFGRFFLILYINLNSVHSNFHGHYDGNPLVIQSILHKVCWVEM